MSVVTASACLLLWFTFDKSNPGGTDYDSQFETARPAGDPMCTDH